MHRQADHLRETRSVVGSAGRFAGVGALAVHRRVEVAARVDALGAERATASWSRRAEPSASTAMVKSLYVDVVAVAIRCMRDARACRSAPVPRGELRRAAQMSSSISSDSSASAAWSSDIRALRPTNGCRSRPGCRSRARCRTSCGEVVVVGVDEPALAGDERAWSG